MFLHFNTIEVIQDLGGIKTAEGRVIKPKLLLRSSELNRLSKNELKLLKNEYNLRDVVDFRSTKSMVNRKDNLDSSIAYHHHHVLDFLEINSYTREIKVPPDDFFLHVYRSLAREPKAIDTYRHFLKYVIACKEGSILWHCTSGKDRTGVATILLLYLLGCDMETIYNHHFAINEITIPILEKKLATIESDEDNAIDYYKAFYLAKRKYIDEYFNVINDEFGSLDEYINKHLKITDFDIKTLRDRYLI
ncbi:MAG: tyrosine-protein phosphatase [Bacilli bacterium]|jgi:protein-tyrosine phosphatase